MKNSLNQNLNKNNSEVIAWEAIQEDFKTKFGLEVFESWLKKMNLLEINPDNLLISVPTRFIRDWITSRYLDNVLQVIKSHNKKINRIEFKVNSIVSDKNDSENKVNFQKENNFEDTNITFLKDTFSPSLQRITGPYLPIIQVCLSSIFIPF